MLKLKLAPTASRRLAGFLGCNPAPATRSQHWQHFSSLNRIAVDSTTSTVTIHAGAGFDSSYELNFRRPTLYETAVQLWLSIRGINPDSRFSRTFSRLWPDEPVVNVRSAAESLRPPLTAHKYLAAHYANLILPALPATTNTSYVEIGPGSGYLAALIHHHRPGRLILIDLPEMLPYSFMLLHRLFPETPFMLPNEFDGGTIQLPESGFVFLTPDQAACLPEHCMDIGVNTASFGEMLPDLVAQYFALLRRISKPGSLFFTCNRVEKWMDDPDRPTAEGGRYCLRFEDYPWSPLDRDVFYARSAFHDLVQPENPMMHRLCHLAPPETPATPS